MKEVLQKRVELFVENRDIVKKLFAWESTYVYPLCANIYASRNVKAEVEIIKECRDLLKGKTSAFSNFRGTAKSTLITRLTLCEKPEEKLEQIMILYEKLKEYFLGSEMLTITASVISEKVEPEKYAAVIQRTRDIYDRMKAAHPFLTSREDSAFAALLAMSDLNDVDIDMEMERCYEILKAQFPSKNTVQSLSHILALGTGSSEDKCKKVTDMYTYLRERGYKYGKNFELPTLGIFALMDIDLFGVAEEIMQVDDYLKTQKGFGGIGIGEKQRLMYAALLVSCDYLPNNHTAEAAAINSTVSMVIASETAMFAALAASSAAIAASSSN